MASLLMMRNKVAWGAGATAVLGLSTGAFAADGDKGMTFAQTIFFAGDVTVIGLLAAASIAGVALIINTIMNVREKKIAPAETTEQLRSLINSRQFKELLEFTSTDQSFVSQALNAGLRRAHLGYPAMREATESAIGEQTAGYFRRIEPLNVIGNIGPLLGLLGTVLGMIIAFSVLAEKGGEAKPSDLSGGIARALGHTFGGLFVAIPCLVTYGFYRTRIDKVSSKAGILTEELLESLRPAEKATAANEETRAPAAKPAPRRVAAPTPQVTEENG